MLWPLVLLLSFWGVLFCAFFLKICFTFILFKCYCYSFTHPLHSSCHLHANIPQFSFSSPDPCSAPDLNILWPLIIPTWIYCRHFKLNICKNGFFCPQMLVLILHCQSQLGFQTRDKVITFYFSFSLASHFKFHQSLSVLLSKYPSIKDASSASHYTFPRILQNFPNCFSSL